MTLDRPERLCRHSYPCVIRLDSANCRGEDPGVPVDILRCFEQARLLLLGRMLEKSGIEPMAGRLSLAFNKIAHLGIPSDLDEFEAGAGVLSVTANSLTIAAGLFAKGKCVAVADSILLHKAENAAEPWSVEVRGILSNIAWRYLGTPAN